MTLSSCITLDRLLSFSFLLCKRKDNNSTRLRANNSFLSLCRVALADKFVRKGHVTFLGLSIELAK